MALAEDIRTLRAQTLSDLNAAHDYYTNTKIAWGIVRQFIAAGHMFSVRNVTTGTVTTHTDLASKSRGYVVEQLAEATFQQFISIFENYFFELLRLWLIAYPQSLASKKVDFNTILDAPNKDAVIFLVVSKEVNEIMYERPSGWFAYLDGQRIDIPELYHRTTWELLQKVVSDVSNAAIAKV